MQDAENKYGLLLTSIALLSVLIPISIVALWISLIQQEIPHEEMLSPFRSYFPPILRERSATINLSLFTSAIALILSGFALPRSENFARFVNISILVVAGALFLFNLNSTL